MKNAVKFYSIGTYRRQIWQACQIYKKSGDGLTRLQFFY